MKIYSHSKGKIGSKNFDDYSVDWSPCALLTNWYFFRLNDNQYDTSEVDESICAQRAELLKPGGTHEATGPICLDIESYRFQAGQWERSESELRKAIGAYRVLSNPMGFYSIMPKRDYWTPVLYHQSNPESPINWRNKLIWETHNELFNESRDNALNSTGHSGLADLVDLVFPSLYTFYNNLSGWKIYAKANIEQARKYNKRIIVWMWTNFHTGGLIPTDFIRQQLDFLDTQEIDGVVWLDWATDPPEDFFTMMEQRVQP